jgi:hypothetical protein
MKAMTEINLSELKKIPYIDLANISGRAIPSLSFYDGNEWHLWFPTPDGRLVDLKGEPAESDYFALEPQNETDLFFNFLNFMTQHAFWPSVIRPINSIRNDVHNLGASLSKLDLYYRISKENKLETTRLVSTEIEYLFIVCRSIFDLLQDIISTIWDKVELKDKSIKKRHLPKSFREMILKSDSLMDVDTISTQFRIPPVLAEFYYRQASFFLTLRNYRDSITHRGYDFKFIFVTEKGFAVHNNQQPFASFNVWNNRHILPNNLASLRPAIVYVITQTLNACEDFTSTIQKTIIFPPEIAPGFGLFIRGFHNKELLKMKDILENCMWWDE